MVKRFLYPIGAGIWANALVIYGSGRLWREVLRRARRSRWAEVAAAVAFIWLLGLLGGSFVVLHLGQNPTIWLPPGVVGLARWLQVGLAVPNPATGAPAPGGWGLGLVGLSSWFCWLVGTQKLLQLVGSVYGDGPSAPASWRARLLPWATALLGLVLAGMVFSLVGQGSTFTQPGLGRWGEHLGRWGLALGSVAVGLALVYRLTPRRWVAGLPLGPGVRLALVMGLALWGLRHWATGWLAAQAVAYAPMLTLGLNLIALYGSILLVPLGVQVNLSTLSHRGPAKRLWGAPPPMAPPPSFDSFKINRRE